MYMKLTKKELMEMLIANNDFTENLSKDGIIPYVVIPPCEHNWVYCNSTAGNYWQCNKCWESAPELYLGGNATITTTTNEIH